MSEAALQTGFTANPRSGLKTAKRSESSLAWPLLAPAIALMVLILLVPVIVAGYLSFTNYSLGNPGFEWVGWQNYERLLSRSTYEKMFGATFRYVFVVVPLTVALGLGAALLIHSLTRFGDLYKTIYFLPVMAALIAMRPPSWPRM